MSGEVGRGADDGGTGVEFIHEDDGRITAVDRETGVASFGSDKSEALRMLADALESHARAQHELDRDEEVEPADAPWL